MMKKKLYHRTVTVFNKHNREIGKVIINLYEPDAFNWEKCKEKGIRVF